MVGGTLVLVSMRARSEVPDTLVMDEEKPTAVTILKESKATGRIPTGHRGRLSLLLIYPVKKSEFTRADLRFLHAVGVRPD